MQARSIVYEGGGRDSFKNLTKKKQIRESWKSPSRRGRGLSVNVYTFNQFPLFLHQFYLHTPKKVEGYQLQDNFIFNM